ncbi:delta [Schistosoma bovis]|uniref:Delta n=1 Tax=Schistosoma bovis TaxID=6184 RepID=A0A430QC27_SCHBO|nr:delta [Schistosoma bovis]
MSSCDSGWYGKDCSQCRVYPGCLHGGCEVGKRNYSLIPFTCECDHGWGGMLCDKDLRYCSSHLNICNNNGICVNNDANIGVPYQCICPPGFHGDHCEIIDYDCRVHGCNENGECIVHETGSTTCYCHPGYHGNLCQFNQTTCEEFPCQATGSICKEREMSDVLFPSNDQQFVCICPPGFEGSNCEININECFEKPCKNGGLCKDVVNGYQCVCPSGYNGDNCETQEYSCITKKCPYGYECFTNSTTSLCVSSIPHKSTALHSSNNQTKSGISFEDIQPTYLKFTQFSHGPSIVIFTLLTLFIVIISLILLKYVLKLNAFRQIAYYNHESDVELNYVRNSMNTRSNFVFNQFKELKNSCYLNSNLYIDHVNKLADTEK